MERRLLLKLIAAGFLPGAASQPGLVSIATGATAYQPQYFSTAEMGVLDRLTELIIPEDDHSPGAHAAELNVYIDVVVSEASDDVKQRWRKGLAAAAEETNRRFNKGLSDCDNGELDQVVAAMAANEQTPSTALDRFFPLLKRATIDGYYTSKIGIHQDLQYQGNTAVSEFPGCTHDEHGRA
jgi:hypothetical protein